MYDVIVLGAGGVGSSALFHLARRGVRVLGLDRFPGGHDRGSSHGDTRIIRLAYFEHPDYVPLLRRSYALWSELERIVDESLYDEVGLLEIGPPAGEVVPGVLKSAALHGLEIERLTPAEVARRFPGFRAPEGCEAVFERRAGYLRVEKCVLAHLRAAQASGAEHRTGIEVRGWRSYGDHLEVSTDQGPITTRKLVITPGAWASDLLPGVSVPWRVLLKQLYWFAPRDDRYRAGGTGCTFFYELPWGMFYGFPQVDDYGVKVAEHSGGQAVSDPLHADRSPDLVNQQRVETFLGASMPGMTRNLLRRSTCFYTMSPDGHFIIDRHPTEEHVVFCAGLSGHGFKFASALGELLADWTLDGGSNLSAEFLRAARFQQSGAA